MNISLQILLMQGFFPSAQGPDAEKKIIWIDYHEFDIHEIM